MKGEVTMTILQWNLQEDAERIIAEAEESNALR